MFWGAAWGMKAHHCNQEITSGVLDSGPHTSRTHHPPLTTASRGQDLSIPIYRWGHGGTRRQSKVCEALYTHLVEPKATDVFVTVAGVCGVGVGSAESASARVFYWYPLLTPLVPSSPLWPAPRPLPEMLTMSYPLPMSTPKGLPDNRCSFFTCPQLTAWHRAHT